MSKIDYFKTQLSVHFTLNELDLISSALATESLSSACLGNNYISKKASILREKVRQFIDAYNHDSSL